MESKIIQRIAAETAVPRLLTILAAELSASDLQSLLLAVYQRRAQTSRASVILARAVQNPLFAPTTVDARLLNTFDRIAFECATNFEALDLAPVIPLGTTSLLGGIDQNSLLTTIRNAEVLGDSTPAMALECGRRRQPQAQRKDSPPVRLCSSHRVVRLQPFDFPGYTPHFRLFALATAGRDTGSGSFERQHLGEHIRFYLDLFRALNSAGFQLTSPLVEISDVSITEKLLGGAGVSLEQVRESVRAHIPGSSERFFSERGITLAAAPGNPAQGLADALAAEYPEAVFRFNHARLEGLGYYTGLCLRISPIAPDGVRYPIADGGFTGWTARLLQDKKERLLTSGIGSEFVCRRYLSGAK